MTALPDAPRALAARRVFIDGAFRSALVRLEGGRIAAIEEYDPDAGVAASVDVSDTPVTVLPDHLTLLPGLVDSHVHLDEPGRTDWEGFETGTAAAAAGGVTTIVDMPLNSVPVTTTPEALAEKRAATSGKLAVDIAYWGGAVPENLGSLADLAAAGVVGFKCFLMPSGIDEFGHLDAEQLEAALAEIAAFDGLLIVHAEDPAHVHDAQTLGPHYEAFLASRPPESERAAIRLVINTARRTGARAHIVHVSDGGALDDIRAAKADGVRLTIETCPHYLTLRAEDVPDAAGQFKCCPPIRDAANQDLLWQGVVDGTIDAIVSDHSPSTLELKQQGGGDFALAWGGISGLQTGFSAIWTAARARGIPLETILPLMTTGPARIAGLGVAGQIAVGAPAHFAVVDLDATQTVRAAELQYRNKMSPWDGRELFGVVEGTYLAGALVYTPEAGVTARAGREILTVRTVAHPAPAADASISGAAMARVEEMHP
ncbi:Allantoinase [Microbacterium sp. C448]|uniref:allantoinase AllB n=1 Tax=Microbacterium TaxID=33882 RepID=UPI0003DE2FF2|nr:MULTISPECIES: allantoinase AllB [Microbacterium]CDK01988.1 Allantoinase [Microbacterium sp. C448]